MLKKTVAGVTTTFSWDADNRLAKISDRDGAIIATYYYDQFGRHLWKEVGVVKTYFHYNIEGLAGEYDAAGNELRTYGTSPVRPGLPIPFSSRSTASTTGTRTTTLAPHIRLSPETALLSGLRARIRSAMPRWKLSRLSIIFDFRGNTLTRNLDCIIIGTDFMIQVLGGISRLIRLGLLGE